MLHSPSKYPGDKAAAVHLNLPPRLPTMSYLSLRSRGEWEIKRQATSPFVHWLVHFNKPHGRDQPMTLVAMSKSLIITGDGKCPMSCQIRHAFQRPHFVLLFCIRTKSSRVLRLYLLSLQPGCHAADGCQASSSVPCHTYCRLALLHSSARVMQENILLDTITPRSVRHD